MHGEGEGEGEDALITDAVRDRHAHVFDHTALLPLVAELHLAHAASLSPSDVSRECQLPSITRLSLQGMPDSL